MSEKQINSSNIESSSEDQKALIENDNNQTSQKHEESEATSNEFDQHILGEYLRSLRVEKIFLLSNYPSTLK